MAFTTDQLNALETAMGTGALEVRYGDKTVKYQSMKDMMLLRDTMRNELGLNPILGGRKYAQYDDGLYPPSCPSNIDIYNWGF